MNKKSFTNFIENISFIHSYINLLLDKMEYS